MSNPKLKNYTTSITADRSIGEIQQMLVAFGADRIMLEADEGRRFVGISFMMNVNGKPWPFKLPVNIKNVAAYLYREYDARTTRGRKEPADFLDEAYRIAWRIIRDWVHAQISIIATEQVRVDEVFLPYLLMDGNRTLSQEIISGKLNRLLPKFEE